MTAVRTMPTPGRTVALVGLMGAGKSAIGRRLAHRLGLPFVDADVEIEAAAGCTIEEFFDRYGEAEFRAGERRVIQRLLDGAPIVVSATAGCIGARATWAAKGSGCSRNFQRHRGIGLTGPGRVAARKQAAGCALLPGAVPPAFEAAGTAGGFFVVKLHQQWMTGAAR